MFSPMSNSPDAAPSQSSPENTRVGEKSSNFLTMQQKIDEVNARYEARELSYEEKIKKVYEIIEEFVRHRINKVPELPWLEERLNPPPMDMPPCMMVPLPKDYVAHERDQDAVVAMIPFAPPLDYIEQPPENLYGSDSDHDSSRYRLIMRILQKYGIQQLRNVAFDSNQTAYLNTLDEVGKEAITAKDRAEIIYHNFTASNNPGKSPITEEMLQKIYLAQIIATWARDTSRDGVSLMRTLHHDRDITNVFHANSLHPDACPTDPHKGAPEHSIVFPMPMDLPLATNKTQKKLDHLLSEIGDWIDNSSRHIEDYEMRVAEISSLFSNIIDSCRWHIEHNNISGQDYEDQIKATLVRAYLGLNTVIQTCQDRFNKGHTFYKFHDLADLISGIKVDSKADGRYRATAYQSNSADYLDAFMAVSQNREVTIEYAAYVYQRRKFKYNVHSGGRSLFGNFSEYHQIRQQLTTMAILYLRMPEWQAELYKDIISDQFKALEKKLHEQPLESEADEPLLFIPTALDAKVRHSDSYPYNIESGKSLFKASFTHALTHWEMMRSSHWHFFKKEDGRTEVSYVAGAAHPPMGEKTKIMGLGSLRSWIDELGFVHPGTEARNKNKQIKTLEVVKKRTREWLDVIAQTPSVLVESRLGRETGRTIEKLLNRDKETGSVRAVASFASMLERLLGRKPTEGETDFISLLKELSLINAESLKINSLDQNELQDTLKRIREDKAELQDLDEGSIILLLLATTGAIPRELLVELVFKSYEAAGSVLTLEAIMALENIDTKRRFRLFGFKRKKPSQILKGKAKLKKIINTKRQENPDYDPILDHEWREQAEKLITKITKLLHANKTYDVTMHSTLISVLTAKEDGQLVARCAVDGELLTAILKFVSPELITYYTQTYGPEENLSLSDWYKFLKKADQSGDQSHGFNQTQWREKNDVPSHTVADATGGDIFHLNPDESVFQKELTTAMEYGEICQQNSPKIYHQQRRVVANCVRGGSHLHSTLALEAGELEYAELTNPDDPIVLLQIIGNTSFSIDRRVKALDKFLLIQPRRLAMSTKADYNRGQTAQRLEAVIDLSRRTNRWNGAFLAANILRHAKFFGPEIKQQGEKLYNLLAQQLAAESQVNFDKALIKNESFLTKKDMAAIEQARIKYLEDLAAKALEQQKRQEEIEREHHRSTTEKINQQIATVSKVVQHESQLLSNEDLQQKKGAKSTLGRTATAKKGSEIRTRKQEIVSQTIAKEPIPFTLSTRIFEAINPETSQKALVAALTGPDGKLLTGTTQDKKMKLIQMLILQVAHELTTKQLSGAASYTNESSALTARQQLEKGTLDMFEALQNGLINNAETIGVNIKPFDPRVELAEVKTSQLMLGTH